MCPAPKYSPQKQEAIILEAAVQCIEESSLLDFTMSALAKQAGISMGSVYKHVQTKEDVLVALATKMYEHMFKIWSSTFLLPLTLPERTIATFLITPEKMQLYSFGVHLDKLISNEAVLNRASDGWIRQMVTIEQQFEKTFEKEVRKSIENKELNIAPESDQLIDEMSLSLWALCVGFHQVDYQLKTRKWVGVEIPDPYPLTLNHPFTRSVQRLLNSYPWKKTLTDEDIQKVCELLDQKGLR